jgi:hypothetical protein
VAGTLQVAASSLATLFVDNLPLFMALRFSTAMGVIAQFSVAFVLGQILSTLLQIKEKEETIEVRLIELLEKKNLSLSLRKKKGSQLTCLKVFYQFFLPWFFISFRKEGKTKMNNN